VNGEPLPVTLDDRAVALTVSGGVLTLAYAGSFCVISGPKLELQRPLRQQYPVYVHAR
jgi:hypothetical protein